MKQPIVTFHQFMDQLELIKKELDLIPNGKRVIRFHVLPFSFESYERNIKAMVKGRPCGRADAKWYIDPSPLKNHKDHPDYSVFNTGNTILITQFISVDGKLQVYISVVKADLQDSHSGHYIDGSVIKCMSFQQLYWDLADLQLLDIAWTHFSLVSHDNCYYDMPMGK